MRSKGLLLYCGNLRAQRSFAKSCDCDCGCGNVYYSKYYLSNINHAPYMRRRITELSLFLESN